MRMKGDSDIKCKQECKRVKPAVSTGQICQWNVVDDRFAGSNDPRSAD